MICSKAMINVATSLERRYGIPYIEASIYGVEDMNHLLRAISTQLGDAELQARVEALIATETAQLDLALAPYRQRLRGKRIVLYTGGVKSWSIVSAAQDLALMSPPPAPKRAPPKTKPGSKPCWAKTASCCKRATPRNCSR
jgi:nitrogenase molybdenum-cofactor synthesis protein NifE